MSSITNANTPPLPYGWVQEHDQNSGHTFFVDTKANPPRSIWTHPYEDEQYLREHPDIKEKVWGAATKSTAPSAKAPSFPTPAHVPTKGGDNLHSSDLDEQRIGDMSGKQKKKGLLGSLKEKAGVAMQEHKQRKAEQANMMNQMNQQRMGRMQGQGAFGPQTHGAYGGHYAAPTSAYPGMMGRQRRGMGGGAALPLAGGLAGGLLLGEMFDNDGYGGGGGGDFGGGDFGGGDFGGGGFDF